MSLSLSAGEGPAPPECSSGHSAPRPPRRRITAGTAQQEALWTALVGADNHVLSEARAGCGKSSSCREGMWRMLARDSALRIRYTVYNKANADEFRADCPPGVDVGTCHSFGYQALCRAAGSRVEKLKSYLILDDLPRGPNLPRYIRKAIAALVSQAKNQFATALPTAPELERLLLHFDINPYGRRDLVVEMAAAVLARSASWTELVDFDDMVWLPVIHQLPHPACDVLFVDEVQDWNPIQHALIDLLCPTGRIVAVGDRFQAIYAWRGADADSIPNLDRSLCAAGRGRGRDAYPLTITFRCPKSHVELARQFVPDFEAHESNPEGVVEAGVSLDDMLRRVAPGDRVICPANAPVVRAALRLIAEQRRAVVRGRAIGDQLVQVVRSCGSCATIRELSTGVERWRSRELTRLADLEAVDDLTESVIDRADGLQAVLSACASPALVEPAINELFSESDQRGAVTLSTVHRAKGLESDNVWFLNHAMRKPKADWEAQQQRNLLYVAVTRSRSRLSFVETQL